MNIKTIQKAVAKIKAAACNSESAHIYESDLYKEFLEFVAESGSLELKEMAKEVLKTKDIKFPRWYV